MSVLHYLAYGSNLHPLRLTSRVPSAQFLGLTTLQGYRLCFHKRHQQDQSGKCNMFLTNQRRDSVIGAVYQMRADEKPLLDQCEGPGYRCDNIQVNFNGENLECFVYIAESSHIDNKLVPHCWYKNIVLLGAEFHRLPDHYLDAIRQVTAAKDPNDEQHHRHYELIEEMKRFKLDV